MADDSTVGRDPKGDAISRKPQPLAILLLALICLVPGGTSVAAQPETPEASTDATPATPALTPPLDDEYHYTWSLGGMAGILGKVFLNFPGHGEGVLTYRTEDGRVRSELLVTSEASDDGEFWQYGSTIDPRTGCSTEAWSAYRWRGKEKSRRQEVDIEGVRDLVAGILALRRNPPDGPLEMDMWSDGKIYPVVIEPKGREERQIGDELVMTRRFAFGPRKEQDARRWKGGMVVWIAEDEAATPVEIRIERSLANLHLRLVEMP